MEKRGVGRLEEKGIRRRLKRKRQKEKKADAVEKNELHEKQTFRSS